MPITSFEWTYWATALLYFNTPSLTDQAAQPSRPRLEISPFNCPKGQGREVMLNARGWFVSLAPRIVVDTVHGVIARLFCHVAPYVDCPSKVSRTYSLDTSSWTYGLVLTSRPLDVVRIVQSPHSLEMLQ
jgi:hypothetical protein